MDWDSYDEHAGQEDGYAEEADLDYGIPNNDPASLFLQANGDVVDRSRIEDIEGHTDVEGQGWGTNFSTSEDPQIGFGMSSADTLQLSRFQNSDYSVIAGSKLVLSGGQLPGMSKREADSLRDTFSKAIGGDTVEFAKRLRVDASVQIPRNTEDLRKIKSMIGETATAKMAKGPGSDLPSHFLTNIEGEDEVNQRGIEGRRKSEEALQSSYATLDKFTHMLIGKEVSEKDRAARFKGVRSELFGKVIGSTSYDGSISAIPMPNEFKTLGLIQTQGIYQTSQGTGLTRTEAGGLFDPFYQRELVGGVNKVLRDPDTGYRLMVDGVSEEDKTRILSGTPSHATTYFPIDGGSKKDPISKGRRERLKRGQAHDMDQFLGEFSAMRDVFRREFPEHRDESARQKNFQGFDRPYGEQSITMDRSNELEIQGVEWGERYQSEAGDMDGGISEANLQQAAMLEEDAHEIAFRAIYDTKGQRTAKWYRDRSGKVTASIADKLNTRHSIAQVALQLAKENNNTALPWDGNADTREGQEGEGKALRSFLRVEGKDFYHSEAGFVENKEFPGMGVSPDRKSVV